MEKFLFGLIVLLFTAIGCCKVTARTDDVDVQGLQSMYRALERPIQLKGWKPKGGDPCGDSWRGVSCLGSSVRFIRLPGLGLSGHVGAALYRLRNLEQLDLSCNELNGDSLWGFPTSITHLNLSSNHLSGIIPNSLSYMKNLRYLNLSKNVLSGDLGDSYGALGYLIEMDLSFNLFTGNLPSSFGSLTNLSRLKLSNNQLDGVLGDFYGGLGYLTEMDLSFNHFSGKLPSSFASLTNLSRLYLQGNAFTGSVVYLAKLQLSDLNIQDNHFSGVLPRSFQNISNLRHSGNTFHNGTYIQFLGYSMAVTIAYRISYIKEKYIPSEETLHKTVLRVTLFTLGVTITAIFCSALAQLSVFEV